MCCFACLAATVACCCRLPLHGFDPLLFLCCSGSAACLLCSNSSGLQSLINSQLMLDPVPHEAAQEQGSLLVAYSVASNQVTPTEACILTQQCHALTVASPPGWLYLLTDWLCSNKQQPACHCDALLSSVKLQLTFTSPCFETTSHRFLFALVLGTVGDSDVPYWLLVSSPGPGGAEFGDGRLPAAAGRDAADAVGSSSGGGGTGRRAGSRSRKLMAARVSGCVK